MKVLTTKQYISDTGYSYQDPKNAILDDLNFKLSKCRNPAGVKALTIVSLLKEDPTILDSLIQYMHEERN